MMRRKLTPLSKALRKNMADAENKLWKRFNHKQPGVMFRRQYPFEKYIVDFDVKLIIEVDGAEHLGSDKDKKRDEWFISQGFMVLRFWDNEIMSNIDDAITEIKQKVDSLRVIF